ncbi:hypothetical protein F4703DRAFT_1856990, partial [Phycomyces blakesleeanus]
MKANIYSTPDVPVRFIFTGIAKANIGRRFRYRHFILFLFHNRAIFVLSSQQTNFYPFPSSFFSFLYLTFNFTHTYTFTYTIHTPNKI